MSAKEVVVGQGPVAVRAVEVGLSCIEDSVAKPEPSAGSPRNRRGRGDHRGSRALLLRLAGKRTDGCYL